MGAPRFEASRGLVLGGHELVGHEVGPQVLVNGDALPPPDGARSRVPGPDTKKVFAGVRTREAVVLWGGP